VLSCHSSHLRYLPLYLQELGQGLAELHLPYVELKVQAVHFDPQPTEQEQVLIIEQQAVLEVNYPRQEQEQ